MDLSRTVARQIATLILGIGLIGAGIGLSATISGNSMLGLQICGATLVIALIVLVLGAVVVGANRPRE